MARPSSWRPISVHPSPQSTPDRVCKSSSAVKSCCVNETTGNLRVQYSQFVFSFKEGSRVMCRGPENLRKRASRSEITSNLGQASLFVSVDCGATESQLGSQPCGSYWSHRPYLAARVRAITITTYSSERELGETEENDKDFSWHDLLAAETDRLERKFRASEEYAVALEKNNLDALKRPSAFAWKWVLLFQLTNLKALSMNHGTPAPANMLMLVSLPRLEKLALRVGEGDQRSCFNVQLSPTISRDAAPVPAQPLDILESVLSSTRCLKSLKFLHLVAYSAEPIQQDAARLKRILDPHAHSLQYLNILVSNSWNDDDEYPGYYSNIKSSLGCLQHFTKLNRLVIQLELFLGKPRDNFRLRNVLPSQLRSFVGFNLNNKRGKRLWKGRNYVPQFQEITEDAADGRSPQLTSVEMCLDKDQSRDGDPQDLRGGAFNGSRTSFEIVLPPSDWDGQQEFNEMMVLAERAYENEPLAD